MVKAFLKGVLYYFGTTVASVLVAVFLVSMEKKNNRYYDNVEDFTRDFMTEEETEEEPPKPRVIGFSA